MHAGEMIREYRRRLGETGTFFGKRFGVTNAYIYIMEEGKRPRAASNFAIRLGLSAEMPPLKRITTRHRSELDGARLRIARLQMDWNLKEAAPKLGVTFTALSRAERGQRTRAYVDCLLRRLYKIRGERGNTPTNL